MAKIKNLDVILIYSETSFRAKRDQILQSWNEVTSLRGDQILIQTIGIKKNFTTLVPRQIEFAIIATNRDVIRIAGLKILKRWCQVSEQKTKKKGIPK